VNECWLQAYPSHNLGSYRSLDRLKFSFIDEGDTSENITIDTK
jgi:hypothetical protein